MIDNGQFEVRRPVLWFRAIGETAPDGPADLDERSTTVYESTLARPGDKFYLVNGVLIHEDREGSLSLGALTLRGSTADNGRESFALTRNNEVALKSILNRPAHVPKVPAERFASTHCGLVRSDVSPAFTEMMNATGEFRHDCDQDGGLSVNCSDFGVERSVSFYVLDIETQTSLIGIVVGSNTRTATITVTDKEFSPVVSASLREAGIPVSEEGLAEGIAWDADAWSAAQASLSRLLFNQSAAHTLALAV
ncbi:hypothetical protein GOB57_07895 [Sinorhizobium meliloti]|nr:hypothetical protein [Sinorhizobium meliloti]